MTAVIYARYSSDSQREASIEGQLRDCKDYAEKNGITVVGTYIDRAYSAKTDDRPDFQRMIKDSGKKIFDVVLVRKENLRCSSGLEAGPLCPEPIRCRELQVPAGKERCPSGVCHGTHLAGT